MASGKIFCVVFLLFLSNVESASILERSYEYFMSLGKNLAPSLLSVLDCFAEKDTWNCAKDRASKVLNSWDADLDKQRRMWQDAADAEVQSSGRAIEELPSKLGQEVEASVNAIADAVQTGVARALSRHHHEDDDTINLAISASSDKKKKKKKTKPPKIHLVQPVQMSMVEEKTTRGFNPKAQTWVIGKQEPSKTPQSENGAFGPKTVSEPGAFGQETVSEKEAFGPNASGVVSGVRRGRGMMADLWGVGQKAVDALAEHALESDQVENGIEEKSSIEEQRGKKKKKKKAILKLLILGAVLKAKIGTLLQILSFKLQVKFFLIALIGLGINLARFWLDLKKQHQPPQKVIYYEHAQHQHHYDHEEAEPGWGPWSRSMEPEDTDVEVDLDVNSPYRAHIERNPQQYSRPLLTRA